MTILSLRTFSGEIPRQPADRLPAGASQYAQNCDFAHGELRPLGGLGTLWETEPAAQPCRALFTDDGSRFFAWAIPTRAYLAPTIDDIYHRVYYENAVDGFRVTQTSQMQQYNDTPGPPGTSWNVGVKPPTSISAVTGASSAWAGDPGAVLSIKILCKQGAATVKTTDALFVTTETLWKSYIVTVPDGTCAASSDGALTPDGDGWITVPTKAFIGSDKIVFSSSGDSPQDFDATDVDELQAGWKINSNGTVWAPPFPTFAGSPQPQYPAGSDITLVFGEVFGAEPGYTNSPVIWYKGAAWAPSELFTALQNGTAGSASSGVETTTAFRTIISNPTTGITYLDEEVTGEALGGGDYRVTIPFIITDAETIAYTATAVNVFSEESANVLPILVERGAGDQVTITVTHTPDANQAGFAGINIYRTYASNNSADFILLNTTPITTPGGGTYTYVDSTIEPQTSTVLQSSGWDEPATGLANLTYVGNGVFAGSLGKDLLLSEPYHPQAWPYRMTFAHIIVGIVSIEGGILVTTTAQPYMVSGGHPAQMSQQILAAEQAGWSETAMARVDGSAIYASNDGLVGTFGGLPKLSTLPLFTRSDWRAAYQAVRKNMRLSQHDGRVVGIVDPSYPAAAASSAFLLHLDEVENAGFCRLDVGTPLYGLFVSEDTDKLYVGMATGFAEFAAGAAMNYTWKSGDVLHPNPVGFSCGLVDCVGTATLEVYAGGALIHTQAISGETTFRLPSILPDKRWSLRLTGTGIIREATIATSGVELRST